MTDLGDSAADPLWWLSCDAEKPRLYSEAKEFRAALEQGLAQAGGAAELGRTLWPVAAILLKPDTLLARRGGAALAALDGLGAEVLSVAPVRFDAALVARLWHYQFPKAPEERKAALARLMCHCPSVHVILRLPAASPDLPASIRLTDAKGPVTPAKRREAHLRSRIGPVQDHLLNYVHTADEPADVIREIALLYPRRAQAGLWRRLEGPAMRLAQAGETVAAVEAAIARHDLQLAPLLARIAAATEDVEVARIVAALRTGARGGFERLSAAVDLRAAGLDPLDILVLQCRMAEMFAEDREPILRSCELADWRAHIAGRAGVSRAS